MKLDERYYKGISKVTQTTDTTIVNEMLGQGWELLKIAEVQNYEWPRIEAEKVTFASPQSVTQVMYILGQRAGEEAGEEKPRQAETKPFPPPPPARSGPARAKDPLDITDKQLNYILALKKKSPANDVTISKFLLNKKKTLEQLTKVEGGDLIRLMAL